LVRREKRFQQWYKRSLNRPKDVIIDLMLQNREQAHSFAAIYSHTKEQGLSSDKPRIHPNALVAAQSILISTGLCPVFFASRLLKSASALQNWPPLEIKTSIFPIFFSCRYENATQLTVVPAYISIMILKD
ncbi:hypothetical protein ACFL2V_10395, partial [Pseudomonadota bacterium]